MYHLIHVQEGKYLTSIFDFKKLGLKMIPSLKIWKFLGTPFILIAMEEEKE
jgi:hypothetical protein